MKDGYRVTRAEINLDNTAHNLREARRRLGKARLMAVVKGDAYGHGMVGLSRFLEKEGVDFFAVALLEEALVLRQSGIRSPILVMSSIQDEEAGEAVARDLAVNLCRPGLAGALSAAARRLGKPAGVHVKVDTGAARYGVLPADAPAFIEEACALEGIRLDGIFSYGTEKEQLDLFLAVLEKIRERGISPPLRHFASSNALCRDFRESYLDLARVGLFLHGSGRDAAALGTKPVFSLKSAVAFSKTVPAGPFALHGLGRELPRPTTIAIVPAGYGDGIPKPLARAGGEVLIRGRRFPVLGIGMDSMQVDAGNENIRAGEPVQVVGSQGGEEITAYEVARKLGIGVNQFTGRVSARVPRIFIQNGRSVD